MPRLVSWVIQLSALASTDTTLLKAKEIEAELLTQTQTLASEQYGIEIQHIGFSRLSLPKENIRACSIMRAERKKFAVEFRAKGEEEASRIRGRLIPRWRLLRLK